MEAVAKASLLAIDSIFTSDIYNVPSPPVISRGKDAEHDTFNNDVYICGLRERICRGALKSGITQINYICVTQYDECR